MKVMEDPGIKLFGKKIVLPEISKSINNSVISTTTAVAGEDATGGGDGKDGGSDHTYLERERVTREGAEKEQLKANYSETGTDESEPEQQNPQPKTLKKPDKILPCPRCTSMDTKFCYFNNYNVNQPRHFCKSCQRYWTAGGAMRNMPVGAGRRKNKNSNSIPSFDSVLQKNQEKNPPHFKISKTHCIPKVSWPNNLRNSIPIPIPPICPSMPVYPSANWNCIPFLPPLTHASDKILGKHSRDELLIKSNDCDIELNKRKNLILIPKTLRIDDPDEAAKSSIWASLGIKNDNFKAFQEKGEETKKHQTVTNSSVLHANPAAFSRSICFQETM